MTAQICTGTAPPCVLTNGYAGPSTDAAFNSRQGVNPYETILSPTSLPSSTTGTLFEVDDVASALPYQATSNPILAEPLYVAGITVPSPQYGTCSPCDMVVAVTLNDTVFAWKADGSPGVGNPLWSRRGTGSNTYGGNALYYDDCGSTGAPVTLGGILQFGGILSTPVIDASGSPPVMFLTSYCVNGSGADEFWLHEIDLTTGHDVAVSGGGHARHIGGTSGDFPGITESWQWQRPALLQVKNSGNSTTPNLIYVVFGTGVGEITNSLDYTGWVVLYQNTSSGLQAVAAYSNEPTSCGTGGGSGHGQCTGNSGSPSCDCYVSSVATPNWGGHGGGCWMSGNGPAATAVNSINSDASVHTFLGCGNGGFQEFNGSTPDSSNNNGQSVLDFRLTSSGYDSWPFQTFTPHSPAYGVAPPLPGSGTCGCNSSGGSCGTCTLTLQTLNANDYDMSVSGVTLFNDFAGNQRVVTADKAGYGYLLTQGNLCASGTADISCIGFAAGDPASWTFGAAANLCGGQLPDVCDRITSLAVFDTHDSTGLPASQRHLFLNYWPNGERLTSLRLSDNATAVSGTGQLTPDPSVLASTLELSASCTMDVNCLSDQIVPGDTLALSGCTCVAGTACPPVVTSVTTHSASDSEINLNMTVAAAFGSSCSFPQSFTFTGYFVVPAHDSTPTVASAGYPGGALTVSANCTSTPCTNGMIWAVVPSSTSAPDSLSRGLGTLYAYTALPNSNDLLALDWNSADTWCASSFARPTVVNGSIFTPTYAVSYGTRTFSSCPTTTTTGIPFPSGILVYH